MHWLTLDQVWKTVGRKKLIKVRFNDWDHKIKYFTIHGLSSDGKKILGKLNTGEKLAFLKGSRGWSLYYPEAENMARAV